MRGRLLEGGEIFVGELRHHLDPRLEPRVLLPLDHLGEELENRAVELVALRRRAVLDRLEEAEGAAEAAAAEGGDGRRPVAAAEADAEGILQVVGRAADEEQGRARFLDLVEVVRVEVDGVARLVGLVGREEGADRAAFLGDLLRRGVAVFQVGAVAADLDVELLELEGDDLDGVAEDQALLERDLADVLRELLEERADAVDDADARDLAIAGRVIVVLGVAGIRDGGGTGLRGRQILRSVVSLDRLTGFDGGFSHGCG